MIEKIYEDLYRIEVPLPDNPLAMLNSYLLCGKERNLLIDTGFNTEEGKTAMQSAMAALGFSMENTDIFITHAHSDHSGLAGFLSRPSNTVYCGKYTAETFTKGIKTWDYLYEVLGQSGIDMGEVSMDVDKHIPEKIDNTSIISEGDYLNVGKWHLHCIDTSGHAPDHFALYDDDRKVLFSGDHILSGITPNITLWVPPWDGQNDPLGDYLKNLDKISELQLDKIFPAHRHTIDDCYTRINELKQHCNNRLEDILNILGKNEMSGYQTASLMKWGLRTEWKNFQSVHKIFAVGEALSHLTHLVNTGILRKTMHDDGVVYYSVKDNTTN
ncbi:MAG: MBL fold metallo-hydrolase [Deferribacterales bacterium]|jgi:glyoxylase-like metal-dependent hydrolase (beta-lactamase superfamily II)